MSLSSFVSRPSLFVPVLALVAACSSSSTNDSPSSTQPPGDDGSGDDAGAPADDLWSDEPCDDVVKTAILTTPVESSLDVIADAKHRLVAVYLDGGRPKLAFPKIDGSAATPIALPFAAPNNLSFDGLGLAASADGFGLVLVDEVRIAQDTYEDNSYYAELDANGHAKTAMLPLVEKGAAGAPIWDGKRFVVPWSDLSSVQALTIAADGSSKSASVMVFGNQHEASPEYRAAAADGKTLFALRGDAERIDLRAYDGTNVANVGAAKTPGTNPRPLDLIARDGGWFATWESYDPGVKTEYRAIPLDASGASASDSIVLAESTDPKTSMLAFGAKVVTTSSGFATAWIEEQTPRTTLKLHLARLDADGKLVGQRVLDTAVPDISAGVVAMYVDTDAKKIVAVFAGTQMSADNAAIANRAHVAVLCPRAQ